MIKHKAKGTRVTRRTITLHRHSVKRKLNSCPKCGGKLTVEEFVSMGPGYREFEGHSGGAPVLSCRKCRKEYEKRLYKRYYPAAGPKKFTKKRRVI